MKHKILAYGLAMAMFLIGAAPASAGMIVTFNGDPLADIDMEGGNAVTLTISDMGEILDLNIAMMINNPYFPEDASITDMTITLSHNGTDVVLFNSTGNLQFGWMDILFDSEAAEEVDESDPLSWFGVKQPHGDLSDFYGMDISGDWVLSFMDNHFEDDGDMLYEWSLIAHLEGDHGGGGCDYDCCDNDCGGGGGGGNNQIPVPSTVLLFGLGMTALGLRRQNRSVAA
ncbi:PEP-CTERM sorting domain-containing protein [Thalassotalea sp. ND16A]|uniref:PEP-CTERM sorting domain-containing protein n=1 Tax=Thalassotalea sp. ND16A TaxID=1535422 RepID=UPI00051A3265|nr:PEP-CTERM sorting domain-containing protein [Thalassotalea sp. ND16A]KGJ99312.1 hypothetical protein ND16A_3833 [Thalassotalea sp. ND16A]